jgi:cysteinyl-tRNA synthetase
VDSALEICERAALAKDFDRVLGLNVLERVEKKLHSKEEITKVEVLMENRDFARQSKNFAESDRIRDELLALGVVIKDNKDGATWEWK